MLMPDAARTTSNDRSAGRPLRVLLADDHPVMRAGLRKLLERSGIQVVAEAGDGDEAVRLALAEHPDIALLDLAMPGVGGLEAARQISGACPGTRIVMLSGLVGTQHVADAARAGAVAFIAKGATFQEMLGVLDAVREGRSYEGPAVAGITLDGSFDRTDSADSLAVDSLTAREREVLGLVAAGHSSASVAAILCVSVRTVETHRQHIMGKLGIHSVAGLTRFAIARGLV
jgi:DNA-binding NarL/FixJ family response regulator